MLEPSYISGVYVSWLQNREVPWGVTQDTLDSYESKNIDTRKGLG